MNFLDLIIIAGFLLGGLAGYRKGLVNAIIGAVSTLISLITAFAGYKILVPVLNNRFKVGVLVRSVLLDTVTRRSGTIRPIGTVDPAAGFAPAVDGMPSALNSEFNQIFINLQHAVTASTSKIIEDTIVQYISVLIVSILAFLIIFVSTFIVLRLISKILTKDMNTGFIGALNSSGGFFAGTLAAFMVIGIVTCFIVPIVAAYSPSVRHLAGESLLTPFFINTFVIINSVFAF